MIFAIGGFGSKILALLLTRLYTSNISPADSSTKELLEITANFLLPIFTFSMAEAVIRFDWITSTKGRGVQHSSLPQRCLRWCS